MFEKGQVNNPKGRPKGSKNKYSVAALQKAFAKAAKQNDKQTILDNLALKAYTNPKLAIQLLKFMMPVLKQVEVISNEKTIWADMSPQEVLEKMVQASAPIEEDKESAV